MRGLLALLLVGLCSGLWAQSYLPREAIDLRDFPAPPESETRDWEYIWKWQLERTGEDCQRVQHEEDGLATSFFGPPYGPLTKEEALRLVDFQERLFKQVNFFNRDLKRRFNRARPYQQNGQVLPCIDHSHPSLSYPSGHSAVAALSALALGALYPELAEVLQKRAQEIALGRVVGGVHFLSDIESGQRLGRMIFEVLIKNAEFLKDLEDLKSSKPLNL
ncbi:MAG: phosphatase PAP2 family protein [Bacteriovoracia bacterium]